MAFSAYLLNLIRSSGLILATWMSVLGYLVAPVLFEELEPVTAGHLVGELLSLTNWAAMGVLVAVMMGRLGFNGALTMVWMPVTALGLIAIGEFGITPYMNEIKSLYPQGVPREAEHWSEFMMWHGVYQLSFLATILVLASWSLRQFRLKPQCD